MSHKCNPACVLCFVALGLAGAALVSCRGPEKATAPAFDREVSRTPVEEPAEPAKPVRTLQTSPLAVEESPGKDLPGPEPGPSGADDEEPEAIFDLVGTSAPVLEPDPDGQTPTPGVETELLARPGAVEEPAVEKSGADRTDTPVLSDAAILDLLRERLTGEWAELQGGLGESSAGAAPTSRTRTAAQLLALTFLLGEEPLAPGILEEALTTAMDREATADCRLLAAACLLREGATDEGLALARQVSRAGEPVEDESAGSAGEQKASRAASPAPGRFHLASLSFARDIQGLGKFVPARREDLGRGSTVLIYGEFRGATTVEDGSSPEGRATLRQEFSARIDLLDSDGRIVDRLEFLPEGDGKHTAEYPGEHVNFWARYTIPQHLDPGEYRLVVHARDLLGDVPAMAELKLTLASSNSGS